MEPKIPGGQKNVGHSLIRLSQFAPGKNFDVVIIIHVTLDGKLCCFFVSCYDMFEFACLWCASCLAVILEFRLLFAYLYAVSEDTVII